MQRPPIHLYLLPTVLAADTAAAVLPASLVTTIGKLDIFFVENLRTARRFISGLQLGKAIDQLTFYELNKDTPEEVTKAQLQSLTANAGILSEAGCPGVADPGAVAVKLAHSLQYKVIPLVGPSAILLALMASGMSGQSFVFHGYLPIDKALRRKAIQQMERTVLHTGQTQLFMETPFRNNQLLQTLLETCAPATLLCIATQLTAPEEQVLTRPVSHWRKAVPDLHKQPTIFLIGS